jgi:hypothetical protein
MLGDLEEVSATMPIPVHLMKRVPLSDIMGYFADSSQKASG